MFVGLPTGQGNSLIFECLTLLGIFVDARPALLRFNGPPLGFSGLPLGFTDDQSS